MSRFLYHTADGVGDICLMTAVAHNYYATTGKKMPFCSSRHDIWKNNPYVDLRFSFLNKHNFGFLVPFLTKILHIHYHNLSFTGRHVFSPDISVDYLLPYNMVLSLGIPFAKPGKMLVTPEIFLSDEEKESGKISEKEQIILNYQGLQEYKTWDYEKACKLAEKLKAMGYEVIQTGSINDKLLSGVLDLRGKTSIRQLASILYASRLYVGPIGGIMNLARAVGCPGVILFSGAEKISQFDYNYTFIDGKSCSFCRDHQIDPYSMCINDCRCTRDIPLEDAFDVVQKELKKEYRRLEPVYRDFSQREIEQCRSEISYVPSDNVFKISMIYRNGEIRKHFFGGIPGSSPSFFLNEELSAEQIAFSLSPNCYYRIGTLYFLNKAHKTFAEDKDFFRRLQGKQCLCVQEQDYCFVMTGFKIRASISGSVTVPPGTRGIRLDCEGYPCAWDFQKSIQSILQYSRFPELMCIVRLLFVELLRRFRFLK